MYTIWLKFHNNPTRISMFLERLTINLLVKKSSALRTGVLSTYSYNTKETVFHTAIHKISNGVLCCLLSLLATMRGTAVAQWLRCCATNRKVAGSISDGVSGIFH